VLADPQVRQVRVAVLGSGTEVAVQRQGSHAAEGNHAGPAALAEHHHDLVVQVEVVERDADALGAPQAGVDQQPDDGGVAAGGEVAALARLEQPAELRVGKGRDRLLDGTVGY
jgi:hypothetical protein